MSETREQQLFIPADREHRERKNGFLTTTELKAIDLKKGTMDVRINMKPL